MGRLNTQFYLNYFFFKIFKFYLFTFRERGREGEGESVRDLVASCMPPTGDLAATLACALTGNRTGDLLVHRSALNPLGHTSQG